ncbi:hypothetical protein PSTT_02970 [Puccinia striiformis]|uniref:Uncharacterized protein n=1 Tax=Puccinia striiformis TaxID=27350 RepID=A0A2S4VY97_9BASI|nr:hypothetical protein PSTT_02970 [Puccinia striiformis]
MKLIQLSGRPEPHHLHSQEELLYHSLATDPESTLDVSHRQDRSSAGSKLISPDPSLQLIFPLNRSSRHRSNIVSAHLQSHPRLYASLIESIQFLQSFNIIDRSIPWVHNSSDNIEERLAPNRSSDHPPQSLLTNRSCFLITLSTWLEHVVMGVNKVVKPKNAMKSKARNQRRHGARHSTVSRDIQACSFAGEKIVWSMREYHPLHLYPAIYAEKKRPSRRPTADELHQAEKIVDRFHPFDHGKVVVLDRTNGAVLAVIQFLPINKLSDEEKVDINFVTTFLHQSKKFVNVLLPVAHGVVECGLLDGGSV